MIKVADLGDEVELEVSLPVTKKELRSTYEKNGFDKKDLETFQFTVRMKLTDFAKFVQESAEAFFNIHLERAEIIKKESLQIENASG